jgi:large subunit GTPase 1
MCTSRLQEEEGLLLTPFERNLEVWRQLWRVIERSHLIVQIVDARNPLLFRSGDLETYVKEVDPKKKNLLLINKADFLTRTQRRQWADYFDKCGIRYTFFSAAIAAREQEEEKLRLEKQEAELIALREKAAREDDDDTESDDSDADELDGGDVDDETSLAKDVESIELNEEMTSTKEGTTEAHEDIADDTHENNEASEADQTDEDDRTRIRTTTNLLDLLIDEAPSVEG